MILISACLAGINCKYSGGNNLQPEIRKLLQEGRAVAVCPEQLGGLSTPRIPSEIAGERVLAKDGRDVTDHFVQGAEKAFAIGMEHPIEFAILKSGSPSCGVHEIYDGTFTGKKIPGEGFFARKLKQAGIICYDENDYREKIK